MSAMVAKHRRSYLCREVPGNVIEITFGACGQRIFQPTSNAIGAAKSCDYYHPTR